MSRLLVWFIPILFVLQSCSSTPRQTDDRKRTITKIHVTFSGKYEDDRLDMVTVCKGFLLSEKQVSEFFVNAVTLDEAGPAEQYTILPCYAAGTALINKQKYTWKIRSGGVGEFYNDNDRFVKVCGKQCCSKISNTNIC